MAYTTLPAKVAGDVFTEAMWTNIKDNFDALRANGSATAPSLTFDSDTNTGIYRVDADRLGFTTAGTKALEIAADGKVLFGNSTDTNLYRSAANKLKTDDSLEVAVNLDVGGEINSRNKALASDDLIGVALSGDAGDRFRIEADGRHYWGDAATSSTPDTNLYRDAANVLKTDDSLVVGGSITSTGTVSGSNAFIVTRSSATTTAHQSQVVGDVSARGVIYADGKIEWGSGSTSRDTNLYRDAANVLKTDDDLIVAGDLTVTGGNLTLGAVDIGGAWTAFTPSWTNVTLGTDATNTGHYLAIGKTVICRVSLTLGTGGSLSGNLRLAWPASLSPVSMSIVQPLGGSVYFDTSASDYFQGTVHYINSSLAGLYVFSGSYAKALNSAAVVPFTWEIGDRISAQFVYEVA